MKRWIRWPGLAAFAVIVALAAVIWYVAVDYAVEFAVEKAGTKAVGARVELSSADLSLFPLGLELAGLQVTNPRQPMRNAVVAEQIRMRFHTGDLIRGKKVIEEMSVTGVDFDQPRKTSGALPERKKRAGEAVSAGKKFASPFDKLPSLSAEKVGEIIEKENLATIESARALQADVADVRQRFENRLENLPDEQKFAQYRQRLKQLREGKDSGGVLGSLGKVKEAGQIKEDIQADLKALRQARQDLTQTRSDLEDRLASLKQAPARDAQRLAQKYSLSPKGIANASSLILGPKYAGWIETGLTWYQRLAPYAAGMVKSGPEAQKRRRGEGVNVEFDTRRAVPDYWVKTAQVSVDGGRISGQIDDISSDQTILGRPLKFAFSGSGPEGAGSIRVTGRMDRTRPDSPVDTAEFKVGQYPIKSLSLLDRPDMAVSLKSVRVDTATGDIRISGQSLAANIRAGLDSAGFDVSADTADSFLASALADALADIRRFDVTARVRGSLDQPEIQLESGMDDTLKAALTKTINRHRDELAGRLKQAISDRTGGQIQDVQGNMSGLDALGKELQKRLDAGSAVLPG